MKRHLAPSEYRPLGGGTSLKQLHHKLLGWYDNAKRPMPWRDTTDPYAIWLSETMLQQTQVETVKPYWHRFLQRFPTVHALAAADLQEVLALWAGLGYYRRARHLHLAAQRMVSDHNGLVPATVEGLLTLPGVGRYTAGAVASIAYGVGAPVVDGNVMRVLSRFTGYDQDIADPKNSAFFWTLAEEIQSHLIPLKPQPSHKLPPPRHGDLNQALMELGALVCTPATPACLLCPLKEMCVAFAEGRQAELPVKRKKAETPAVQAVALVITKASSGEVLLLRRPASGVWADMWEFPVLSMDENGTKPATPATVKRWALENLGLSVQTPISCGTVEHQLTHRRYVYQVMHCSLTQAEAVPLIPATYVAAYWSGWPLAARGDRPIAKVVHKIAACVAATQAVSASATVRNTSGRSRSRSISRADR